MKKIILRTFIILCIVFGFAGKARPDATIIVTNSYQGILYYQMGGNTTPYIYWPEAGNFDQKAQDIGVTVMRWWMDYGDEGRWVHDGSLYPYKNGWQWTAASMMENLSIQSQISFFQRNNIGVLPCFHFGLNDTISYPDATVDYQAAGDFYAGIVNYIVNVRGVAVPFLELGNECDLSAMPRARTGKYNRDINSYNFGFLNNSAIYSQAVQTNLEYFNLFQALYPKIKAVSPSTKISAFPMGGGLIPGGWQGDGYFNSLYKTPGWYHPDVRSLHRYPNKGNGAGQQANLDAEYQYSGFICPSGNCTAGGWQSVQGELLSTAYGITNGDVMMSEWDYDAGSWIPYTAMRNSMWGVDYYLTGLARMVSAFSNYKSFVCSTFFETFQGANTDHLIDGQATSLSSLGMGMRLMRPLRGLDKKILRAKITTADNINIPEGGSVVNFARACCIAVRGNTYYAVMINNSDTGAAQNVTVTMRALTNNPMVIQVYSNLQAASNYTPSLTQNGNLVAGVFNVSLPPLGVAVVTIPYGGLRTTNVLVAPSTITNNNPHIVVFNIKALSSGAGMVTNVSINLTAVGGGSNVKMTNISGNTQFRYSYTVPSGLFPGVKQMPINARDNLNNVNLGQIAFITDMLAPPKIVVTNISALPYCVTNYKPNIVIYQLNAKDLAGGTITNVLIDLSTLSGDPNTRMSNISGNTLWRYTYTVPAGLFYGKRTNDIKVFSSYYGTKDFSHSCTNLVMFYRQIPGTIHLVDYNFGGEGVAYHDSSPGNSGGLYRNDDVDIAGYDGVSYGGFYVGWISSGEWLEFTVNVQTTGYYYLTVRDKDIGGSFFIQFDGVDQTGNIAVNDGNAWTTLNNIASNIPLIAGVHEMRMNFNSGSTFFNWVKFDYQGPLGIMSARSLITNVSLNGVPTGSKNIPGSTITIQVFCTNGKSNPATGSIVYQAISTNLVYATNSSIINLPPQWVAEWSTNKSPDQSFTSLNYTGISPAVRKVRWVRWRRTGGPMPSYTSVLFRYSAVIK